MSVSRVDLLALRIVDLDDERLVRERRLVVRLIELRVGEPRT